MEVVGLLKIATIGVVPNTGDSAMNRYTSPLKVLEYMAAGLPIVASDLKVLREVLVENENAIFFRPDNERSLAMKISSLLEDEKQRVELSANNLRKAKSYSWEMRAKGIWEFIDGQ